MNKLFDRIRLQAMLRSILKDYGDEQGYEIIQSALEKEIRYEQYRKTQRSRTGVVDNSVCRTQPLR